jgi:hypothetical protein
MGASSSPTGAVGSDGAGGSGSGRRSKGPRQSLSSGNGVGSLPDDDAMARMQGATLARQRKLQLEEARRTAKAKARSLELLEMSLAREAALRAQMVDEGKKLTPRSADAVRVRMLLSRKPVKLVHAQLRSVGMTLEESPKARRELDAFGQMQTVESTKTNRQLRRQAQLQRTSMDKANMNAHMSAALKQLAEDKPK